VKLIKINKRFEHVKNHIGPKQANLTSYHDMAIEFL